MTKQNEEKLDFVDATTHELKTFLTAIIVSAELLADELSQRRRVCWEGLSKASSEMPTA